MHLTRSFLSVFVFAVVASGCYRPEKPKNPAEKAAVPVEWYVHCDTCVWCKGPFRHYQDAEKLSREHNLKKHDYVKVAYYDTVKCSK